MLRWSWRRTTGQLFRDDQLPISGSGTLVKTGSTMLIMSAADSYTGGTILTSGTLVINNASALGTGPLTISGGTIDNTFATNLTLGTNNGQFWNGDFAYLGSRYSLNLGTGAVSLGGNRNVTVAANTLTVGGAISDGGGVLQPDQIGHGRAGAWRQPTPMAAEPTSMPASLFCQYGRDPLLRRGHRRRGGHARFGRGDRRPLLHLHQRRQPFPNSLSGVSMNGSSMSASTPLRATSRILPTSHDSYHGVDQAGGQRLDPYRRQRLIRPDKRAWRRPFAGQQHGIQRPARQRRRRPRRRRRPGLSALQWHERLDERPDQHPA